MTESTSPWACRWCGSPSPTAPRSTSPDRRSRGRRAAAQLGIEEDAPLLLLEGESEDAEGRLLEAFQTWHRADLVTFDVATTSPGGLPLSSSPLAPEASIHDLASQLDEMAGALAALQSGLARLRVSLGGTPPKE